MKKTILSALFVTSFAFAASAGSFMWQAALGFSPSGGNLDFASTWQGANVYAYLIEASSATDVADFATAWTTGYQKATGVYGGAVNSDAGIWSDGSAIDIVIVNDADLNTSLSDYVTVVILESDGKAVYCWGDLINASSADVPPPASGMMPTFTADGYYGYMEMANGALVEVPGGASWQPVPEANSTLLAIAAIAIGVLRRRKVA